MRRILIFFFICSGLCVSTFLYGLVFIERNHDCNCQALRVSAADAIPAPKQFIALEHLETDLSSPNSEDKVLQPSEDKASQSSDGVLSQSSDEQPPKTADEKSETAAEENALVPKPDGPLEFVLPLGETGSNAKIALVLALDMKTWEAFGYEAILNLQVYCKRHGYAMHLFDTTDKRPKGGYAFSWDKVMLTYELIQTGKYDVIVALDADLVIVQHEKRLEEFLAEADALALAEGLPQPNIVIGKDPFIDMEGGTEDRWINSGVIMFRDTPWVRNYLQALTSYEGKYQITWACEQRMMGELLKAEMSSNATEHHLVRRMEENRFNSSPWHYKEGDFLYHAMGHNAEFRRTHFREFNRKLGIEFRPSMRDIISA